LGDFLKAILALFGLKNLATLNNAEIHADGRNKI